LLIFETVFGDLRIALRFYLFLSRYSSKIEFGSPFSMFFS
jgi:hypothetical protein